MNWDELKIFMTVGLKFSRNSSKVLDAVASRSLRLLEALHWKSRWKLTGSCGGRNMSDENFLLFHLLTFTSYTWARFKIHAKIRFSSYWTNWEGLKINFETRPFDPFDPFVPFANLVVPMLLPVQTYLILQACMTCLYPSPPLGCLLILTFAELHDCRPFTLPQEPLQKGFVITCDGGFSTTSLPQAINPFTRWGSSEVARKAIKHHAFVVLP